MRKFHISICIVGILAIILTNFSWAQQGRGPGQGWGSGSGRIYNPQTVETLTGDVVSVESIPGRRGGRSYGVHLTLKTNKETILVHLGPSWYIDKQGIKIEPKDKVEVTGSRVTYQGKPTIIAGQVKKDGKTLQLRDANGVPAWAGQRWR